MNYIIFDLEWNTSKYDPSHIEEVIEIGALKVSQELVIIDTFSSFVKPLLPLTGFTKHLTGISESDINHAPSFSEMLSKFKEFIGDDFYLVAWGKEDFRFLLKECLRFSLEPIDDSNKINLLSVVLNGTQDFAIDKVPSLLSVLDFYQLQKIGDTHRALDDAKNTLLIFRHLYNKINVHTIYHSNKTALQKYTYENKLNSKGKKLLKNSILVYMIREKNDKISELDFFSSNVWTKKSKEHNFGEEILLIFHQNFNRLFQTAKDIYLNEHLKRT